VQSSKIDGRRRVKSAAATIRSIWKHEEGQTLVEYTLILVIVSIVGIALLTEIGLRVEELLQGVLDGFS
jgi:Flp pilus assembly pilin Flp